MEQGHPPFCPQRTKSVQQSQVAAQAAQDGPSNQATHGPQNLFWTLIIQSPWSPQLQLALDTGAPVSTSLHGPGLESCLTPLLPFFKQGSTGARKATITPLHAWDWVRRCPFCSFHDAKFIFKDLALSIGNPWQGLSPSILVAVICPGAPGPFISFL